MFDGSRQSNLRRLIFTWTAIIWSEWIHCKPWCLTKISYCNIFISEMLVQQTMTMFYLRRQDISSRGISGVGLMDHCLVALKKWKELTMRFHFIQNNFARKSLIWKHDSVHFNTVFCVSLIWKHDSVYFNTVFCVCSAVCLRYKQVGLNRCK